MKENGHREHNGYQNMRMTLVENHIREYPSRHSLPLPETLAHIYGSDSLDFIENPAHMEVPLVYVNFVMSKEGIYNISAPGRSGGGPIAHGNQADAFGMALLRASADAIMVGSRTLENEPHHRWHLDFIFDVFPHMKEFDALRKELKTWRRTLDKPTENPPVFFMTRSGRIDLETPDVFGDYHVLPFVVTTPEGASHVRKTYPDFEKTVLFKGKETSTLLPFEDETKMMLYLRKDLGISYLLHEGGRAVINALTEKQLVTQFFLTQMNHSPRCNTEELTHTEYLFGTYDHQIPTGAAVISKRTDATGKATLYNLDFRDVLKM